MIKNYIIAVASILFLLSNASYADRKSACYAFKILVISEGDSNSFDFREPLQYKDLYYRKNF